MRLGAGDEIIMVDFSDGWAKVAAATAKGHVLLCGDEEVPILGGPGKGVKLIKLGAGDAVIAAKVLIDMANSLVVEKEKGGAKFEITIRRTAAKRGGKGTQLFKRGRLAREVPSLPQVPELLGDRED